MGRIRLNVLGISYSQTQTGAYALVLAEESGKRRIPIIVGGFEAQSIAIQLEGLKPPRPLTHDLFFNFARKFAVDIIEVTIHKLEEGVFHSKLTCHNSNQTIEIDARTSDAIALALRFKCPIYTTSEIIEKSGIILDFDHVDENQPGEEKEIKIDENFSEESLSQYDISDLQQMLDDAVQDEDYEKASMIRDEIHRRSKN